VKQVKKLSGIGSSQKVYKSLKNRISKLKGNNIIPTLAVILVGNDLASSVYVRAKQKMFDQMKLKTETFKLRGNTTESLLLKLLAKLNNDINFHGILIQLPLPKHINANKILYSVDPKKDVDGFHPENMGLLSVGKPRFIPCTPKGIMRIFEYEKISLIGKHVVVIGRSNIVGRPISILTSLKNKHSNATTTLCHSGSRNIKQFIKQADILIVAIGKPNYINGGMLKSGVVIIDVGINKSKIDNGKNYKLFGDVDWESIKGIAHAATPVPGGVGPMTIAMLLENTVDAAEHIYKF
tara:strand:+ start:6488 stop:7372 length:885 start_codon:yes stop_codon:yes gene_type:complete